ncbi:beta-fructofuranosidase [Aequitasia blattaphilus]|uniref:beta-fructofuranosidase n=1 Tax=Aequitasia blattaphilus TaxID=2949332 RepID=A0ABT1E7Q9_9FIRM|nr:glycoside hydrolase family 32 protein [Aequitasia blattaphilus]MCP1101823.1 family 43 glycosylhydrolase [Aequitasia blattaphilus]MCR8614463.1 family 43 glycosylhydrolase [Aequitasia blattaphilus]
MNIFRKPSFADSTGDAIPLYHDGIYHIFSLTPPKGTTVYPDRLRTTWSHTISRDLVNWEEVQTALYPGEGDEPDADGIWTGAAIYGEGKYHIFYTGYNYHLDKNKQTICHATSADGLEWKKNPNNPIITPILEKYEPLDWRDPYVFYNEEEKCYWMLISARLKEGPPTKTGSIVLYKSENLEAWEHYGPIYTPYHTNCPECCEMYKVGDNWYLSYSRFSEFVDTIYRVSKSPYGPWRTPKMDGIGGRRFYAAKSMVNEEGRRFYFAWAHDRANGSDDGDWYWGGEFCVPHEVQVNERGELDVKMPKEIVDSINERVEWKYEQIWGKECRYGQNSIVLDATSTMNYGFFSFEEKSVLFSCKMKVGDCRDHFGLLLKSNRNAARCLELRVEPNMQRVSLVNLPMDVDPFWRESTTNVGLPKNPGPDGIRVCEKPFSVKAGDTINLKVVIDHDMVEIFVGDKVAFTYRVYEDVEYEVGLQVQDGIVEYYDIDIRK